MEEVTVTRAELAKIKSVLAQCEKAIESIKKLKTRVRKQYNARWNVATDAEQALDSLCAAFEWDSSYYRKKLRIVEKDVAKRERAAARKGAR